MAEKKVLSKKALHKSWLDWMMWSHSNYNYERLQSIAYAQMMYHTLADLYDTKEEIGRELAKHCTFFNTEPNVGAIIMGVVCAMEEERANTGGPDSPVTEDSIIAIKTGLMGPFAGIGDTITQGIMCPVMLAICIGLAMQDNMAAPWIYGVSLFSSILLISYLTWMYGYRWGRDAVTMILEGGMMETILLAAGILGCTVMGALASANVQIYTPLKVVVNQAAAETDPDRFMYIQEAFFDAIFKGLLPVAVTFTALWMMRHGFSPVKIILILGGSAFVLGALGIISNSHPTTGIRAAQAAQRAAEAAAAYIKENPQSIIPGSN